MIPATANPNGEPRTELSDYLADLGDGLFAAHSVQQRRPPRRSRRPYRALAGAGALVAAGVVAALVISAGSPAKLNVVSEALAALAPQGQILHIDMTVTNSAISGGRPVPESALAAAPQHLEQWSASDPPRWRIRVFGSTRPRANPHHTVQLEAPAQVAYARGAQSGYDPRRHQLNVITGFSDHGPAARPPSPSGVRPSIDDVRVMLQTGRLQDRGLSTVGGRQVRRITGVLAGSSTNGKSPATIEYDVDPASFAPVRVIVERPIPAFRTNPAITVVTSITFRTYERIPLNVDTAQLLTIHPAAGTKITTHGLLRARPCMPPRSPSGAVRCHA